MPHKSLNEWSLSILSQDTLSHPALQNGKAGRQYTECLLAVPHCWPALDPRHAVPLEKAYLSLTSTGGRKVLLSPTEENACQHGNWFGLSQAHSSVYTVRERVWRRIRISICVCLHTHSGIAGKYKNQEQVLLVEGAENWERKKRGRLFNMYLFQLLAV